jgi:hypothetical protein
MTAVKIEIGRRRGEADTPQEAAEGRLEFVPDLGCLPRERDVLLQRQRR